MSLQKYNVFKTYLIVFVCTVFFLLKCDLLFAQKNPTDSTKVYHSSSDRGVNNISNSTNEDSTKVISNLKASNATNGDSVQLSNQQYSREQEELEKVNSINWLVLLLTGLLSFMGGSIISFFVLKLKLFSKMDENDSLKSNISKYEKNEFDLKRRIKELEKTVATPDNSNNDITESEKLSSKLENRAKSNEMYLSKDGSNKSTSYFSIPENDGRFIIEKGEQTNDGSKYYKVEYQVNSNEGDLIYISGTQDKRAINRLDSYLKPVCDIDNILNAETASSIELIKHGRVIKISESWVIDINHKVKIKLV